VQSGISNVTATSTIAPSKDIQPGGTLTFYTPSEIASLDPVKVANFGSTDGPAASMVYDMLVYNDLKANTLVAQTAESLTSSDGSVWTLKVRPNIKFSDGTAYDAAAVKFNWDRIRDPKNAAARASAAAPITDLTVVDPLTLKITLSSPNAGFPQSVVLIDYIGSPTAIKAEGDGYGAAPVGAGAFTLKSWVRDSQMVLQRNPGYWNAPRPYLDQVIVKDIVDTSQRINTFGSTSGSPSMMLITAVTDVDSAQASNRDAVANISTLNGGLGMWFNMRKAPFNDLRTRQAIAMAVDRSDFSKVVDQGKTPVMDSIFAKTSPFYDASITQIGFDSAKAQTLFNQIAADNGGPLTFTLNTPNTSIYPTAAQYIQGILNKYNNVKVSVNALNTATANSALAAGDFQASLNAIPFYDPDPLLLGPFTCAAQAQQTGYCNSNFDAAVNKYRSSLDANTRISAIKDAQKQFYSDIPVAWYEPRTYWVYTTPNIQDFGFANDVLELFDRMWIKTH
jgi:peptide/nickel transport system substrate-binding protein